MNTKAFIDSLCEGVDADIFPEPIEAILVLDGQPAAIGKFSLQTKRCGQATFRPKDGKPLPTPKLLSGTMKLTGKDAVLLVSNLRRCANPNPDHYHFDFEV